MVTMSICFWPIWLLRKAPYPQQHFALSLLSLQHPHVAHHPVQQTLWRLAAIYRQGDGGLAAADFVAICRCARRLSGWAARYGQRGVDAADR